MKKILILICLILAFGVAKAQKKQNVYFFKNDGKEVSQADSADFVRIIQEPDSGDTNFVLLEYYVNKKRKTLGKVSAFEPNLILEGAVSRFNQEGKRISHGIYQAGLPIGMHYEYFGDGKMNRQVEYLADAPKLDFVAVKNPGLTNLINPNYKLIYQADSGGTVLVKDGNGHLVINTVMVNDELIEEGDFKDGVKDGIWTGRYKTGKSSYTETYQLNKLVSGESVVLEKKYPYTSLFEGPQFKGGIQKFYQFIGSSLRYPTDAVRGNNTGTVILNFLIDYDGKISDIQIKQSASESLDDEAKRVLRLSPVWIPAKERGIPVSVRYTIPIKFSTNIR